MAVPKKETIAILTYLSFIFKISIGMLCITYIFTAAPEFCMRKCTCLEKRILTLFN